MSDHPLTLRDALIAAAGLGVLAAVFFSYQHFIRQPSTNDARRELGRWLAVHAPDAGVTCADESPFGAPRACTISHPRFAAPVALTCTSESCVPHGCR